MYLFFRSRARYTFPNFPRPRGFPMSKSVSCHRALALLLVLSAVRLSAAAVLTGPVGCAALPGAALAAVFDATLTLRG